MLLIAHRGNLYGPQPEQENSPDYLNDAISLGYHVMVDAWWHEEGFWFGSSGPRYKLMGGGEDWLIHSMNSLWVHARNPDALLRATDLGLNVFWRQTDQYALSTWKYLLGFHGVPTVGSSFVHVFPHELEKPMDNQFVEQLLQWCEHDHALCADYVGTVTQYLCFPSVSSDDPRVVSTSPVA